MTSNIGSSHLLSNSSSKTVEEGVRNQVMAELKTRFKPEFLNRVDDTILFKPLTLDEIASIIDIFLDQIRFRLKERNITLKITSKAKELIAVEGYDPIYGARPLKRYLQNTIETELARKLIKGDIFDGDEVGIDVENEKIILQKL